MFAKYIFNLIKIGVCPFGEAFVDSPLGDLNKDGLIDSTNVLNEWRTKVGIAENLEGYASKYRLHRYAECSNAGLCNREQGVCECFAGYEGSACQRHSCPTSNSEICSGNGMCLPSTILASLNKKDMSWEYEKFPVCKCDNGWSGIDCSKRNCPKGFDPVHERLEYSLTFGLIGDKIENTDKYIAPKYHFNIVYDHMKYTSITLIPRDISACYPEAGTLDVGFLAEISEEIKRAIHIVPDFTQTTVSAHCDMFDRATGEKYDGKVDTIPTGNGNSKYRYMKGVNVTISLKYTDYDKFFKNGFQFTVHSEEELSENYQLDKDDVNGNLKQPVDLKTLISNSKEYKINGEKILTEYLAECGQRGLCQADTGLCKCFDGYSGTACETQRSIAL